MTGIIKRVTTNLKLRVPRFDTQGWGRELERNFDILDTTIYAYTGLSGIQGIWENNTAYTAGNRVIDDSTNTLYVCDVSHTSATTGSFAADRAANPTYWSAVVATVNYRGTWTTATVYNINDIVFTDQHYAIATETFTSGASLAADVTAGSFATIVNFTTEYADILAKQTAAAANQSAAETAQTAAEDAQAAAETAETNAASSASAASSSASAAASSASTASTAATDAQTAQTAAEAAQTAAETAQTGAETAETNAETQATNAAASAASINLPALAADIIPDTDGIRDIGSSAKRFAEVHADRVYSRNDVGNIIMRASTNVPAGTLECNGAAVSRTTYADLFAEIGTTHGVGDGSTTFNVPDYRGEFLRGWDHGRGVDIGRTLGSTQSDMVGNHTHGISDFILRDFAGSAWAYSAGSNNRAFESNATQGVVGTATETRPRNKSIMYCIVY